MKHKLSFILLTAAALAVILALTVSAASVIEVTDVTFEPDDVGFRVEVEFAETDYSGLLSVFLASRDFTLLTAASGPYMIHADVTPMPQDGHYSFAIRRDVLEKAAGSSEYGTVLYLIIGSIGNPTYHKAVTLKYPVPVTGSLTSYDPGTAAVLALIPADPAEGEAITCTIPPESGSGQVTQTFSFPKVPEGTYRLRITKPHHLTYEITGVTVGKEAVDLTQTAVGAIRLIGGDVNGDGVVSAMDVQKLWRAENGLDHADADLNGDAVLNEADYAVILAPENFGRSSAVPKS